MSYWNLSAINGTGILPLMQTVNTSLMYGWFGPMLLITIFVILMLGYMAASGNDFKRSAGVASLFTAIFSVFLRSLMLISDMHLLIAWIVAAVIAAITFFSD